jgi:hypothetical protein
MQSVPITTNVVSSNPAQVRCEVSGFNGITPNSKIAKSYPLGTPRIFRHATLTIYFFLKHMTLRTMLFPTVLTSN